MDLLKLEKKSLKPLVYDEVVRKDLKLLEIDDEILQQIESGE